MRTCAAGGLLFFALTVAGTGGAWGADVTWHGFLEGGFGARTAEDSPLDGTQEYTLKETRAQIRMEAYGEQGEVFVRLDILGDQVPADRETETTLREGYLRFSAINDHLDVKMGRQALTWGTGDLIFINDLFPKDWVSFFIGREDQYLKGPADAVRLGFFGLPLDVDLVLIPEFTPDKLPTGERLSFYTPSGSISPAETPADLVENGEVALRLSRYVGDLAVAAYGYHGFFKTPVGMTDDMRPFYPKLSVYGASVRGAGLGGVFWLEGGYYHSRNDREGEDPGVINSSSRFLGGFERQVASDFNVGVQWYGEWMKDHEAYAARLSPGGWEQEELRQIATIRLEKMMKYQTVRLSLFTFYSPTDEDLYVRGLVSYKMTDNVAVAVGGNLFEGEHQETQFGQFDRNDNIFTRIRYSF